MNWISLEQLIKNNDINHVKTAVSWSFNDLSQYFGSDWNLALLPMGNSRLLTKVDNVYSFPYASDSSDSYFAIPLKQDYNVQGIRFKCSINFNSYNPLAQIRVGIRNSTFTSPNSETLGICYDTSVAQNCDYNTIDTIFHEYTKTISNYVGAYIVFTGIIGEISLKDIELYCDATTYTWQSVPSISGKNGILSLVTLDSEAINDGEPVSGAAVSVFDQAPSTDNNVKDLADTYGSGEESSAVDVTVKYKVTLPPGGAFNVLKLVAKKDSIPEDATDGDKIVDISPTKTKKTVTGLDENSTYYFKIFAEDSNSNTSESDEKHILTSGDEGYNFDYTGEIVEWTVPKTGIYSLETWGAQGGEATDGTLTARGGYGAYAYGEVLLTQGEKLYINVGGQNGYGGGGNFEGIERSFESLARVIDVSPYQVSNSWSFNNLSQYFNTDNNLVLNPGGTLRIPTKDSSDAFVFANVSPNNDMNFLVQFKKTKRVMGVKVDIAGTEYSNNSNDLFYVFFGKFDGNSASDYNDSIRVWQKHSTASQSTNYLVPINDNDYHTYEVLYGTSFSADYMNIYTTQGTWKIKNIVFICED